MDNRNRHGRGIPELVPEFCIPLSQVDRLRRHISLMQLQRVWGRHQEMRLEGRRELLTHCQQWYKKGLKLGRELPSTVNQHSDFYAVLATHLQLELHHETGELEKFLLSEW